MKRAALGMLLAVAAAGPAFAQAEWPARPIRLIVPFTAGSSSDIVARIVAQKLGERLRQQEFVEIDRSRTPAFHVGCYLNSWIRGLPQCIHCRVLLPVRGIGDDEESVYES